jgi:hypothetical protein
LNNLKKTDNLVDLGADDRTVKLILKETGWNEMPGII